MYTAPDSIITDTIYSVANSIDGDGNPQPGDKWNFGENIDCFGCARIFEGIIPR